MQFEKLLEPITFFKHHMKGQAYRLLPFCDFQKVPTWSPSCYCYWFPTLCPSRVKDRIPSIISKPLSPRSLMEVQQIPPSSQLSGTQLILTQRSMSAALHGSKIVCHTASITISIAWIVTPGRKDSHGNSPLLLPQVSTLSAHRGFQIESKDFCWPVGNCLYLASDLDNVA